MIIEGIVTKVDTDLSKKVYLEVRLTRINAILFDGDSLIEEPQSFYIAENHRLGINESYIDAYRELFSKISNHNVIGFIRKHDVTEY